MQKTITLEVSKLKKSEEKKLFEWTKTFEIDYDLKEKKVFEDEHEIIQKEIELKNSFENNDRTKNNSPLIDTQVLLMDSNPFYQPSMNTFEFNVNNDLVVHVSSNQKQPLTLDEKLVALQKLLEEEIITDDEYDKQKNQLLSF